MKATVPILLVHGIDNTGKRLNIMRSALIKRGFKPVEAMDIVPSDASISFQEMGAQVQEATVHLLDSSHAAKIDIVAYSMGALAARYFLQKLGGKCVVRRFVSISGPHHGTVNAWLRPGVGCRQMRPNSRFLQDLNSDPNPFGAVEVFSFYTPYDLMILPSRSSILNGARNHAFKVWLHPLMTFDHKVIEAVARALAGDNPIP